MKSTSLTLLACSLLLGCSALGEAKREQFFSETTLSYENAIRWSEFAAATRFQRLPTGTTNPPIDADKLKVTAYREIGARRLAGGEEVILSVQIDYYHKDTMKVRTLRDEQLWRYHDREESWYVTTPLPDFR